MYIKKKKEKKKHKVKKQCVRIDKALHELSYCENRLAQMPQNKKNAISRTRAYLISSDKDRAT